VDRRHSRLDVDHGHDTGEQRELGTAGLLDAMGATLEA
jgi:hypothetical protein